MTKTEYRKRYRALVRDTTKYLLEFGEKALTSGAIDLPSEPTNYALPKNVLCAACERLASPAGHGLNPSQRKHRKTIQNLRVCVPLL